MLFGENYKVSIKDRTKALKLFDLYKKWGVIGSSSKFLFGSVIGGSLKFLFDSNEVIYYNVKEVREINRSDLKVTEHTKVVDILDEISDLALVKEIMYHIVSTVSSTKKLLDYFNLVKGGFLPWKLLIEESNFSNSEKDELAHRVNVVKGRLGLGLLGFYYDRDYCEVRVVQDINTDLKFLLWCRDDIISREVYITPFIKGDLEEDYVCGIKDYTSLFYDLDFSDEKLKSYLGLSCNH